MNVKSVEKEATRASVTVELTREELEPALNRAYLKYRKDIMIPGFRKGHAPRMVIEAAYGKHVFFEDAVEDMFPDIYKDAVLTQDIRPVGRPSVSKMDIADDGAVTLTIVTDLYPVAELGEYKNLEIEKAEVEVKESEVEAELDRMAQNVARITTVDRPAQEGDTAVIDFEGFENGKAFAGGKGENYELKLGSHTFIPGFEEQVAGMSAGEEKDIDITFPAEYGENPDFIEFVSGPNGMRNYFTFCARGAEFPGEVRSKEWVWTQIAKRLGDEVVEGYNPRMKDVEWEDWVDEQEKVYKEAVEKWIDEGYLIVLGKDEIKTWEDFNANPVVRTEIHTP